LAVFPAKVVSLREILDEAGPNKDGKEVILTNISHFKFHFFWMAPFPGELTNEALSEVCQIARKTSPKLMLIVR
jgi:hypothetical protein